MRLLMPLVGLLMLAATAQPVCAQETLTLEEAVRIGLTRSPSLRQAEAVELQEGAGELDRWDRLFPSLTFSTGLNQSEVLQRTASDPITGGIIQLPDSLIRLRETFGTQGVLSASWTLFDGGESIQGLRQSRAEGRAAGLALHAARTRVAATVTLAYLDALEAAALETALQAEVVRAQGLEATAVGRFDVGEVPEVDALQARLATSDAELSLMEAETASFAARLNLFQHLRLPADSPVELEEPGTVPGLEDLSLEELRQVALTESRELAALQARVQAAERGHDAQRWWFLPSVSVGGQWIRSEFGQTREAITFAPRNEQAYYRLNFSWNPMERLGGTLADGRRARAAVSLAEAELDIQRATVASGVEAALDRMARAQVLEERSEVNLQLAARQLEQAEERYRLGLAPLTERLTAEALAADAQRQAIVARYAGLRGLAELEMASGVPFLPWSTGGP
ncbi:MAG: TolC family protein [Gemmatimonadota bacterium]